MVSASNNFAALFLMPSRVIVLAVSRMYLSLRLVISVGVIHFISPPQYSGIEVLGVPPPMAFVLWQGCLPLRWMSQTQVW